MICLYCQLRVEEGQTLSFLVTLLMSPGGANPTKQVVDNAASVLVFVTEGGGGGGGEKADG